MSVAYIFLFPHIVWSLLPVQYILIVNYEQMQELWVAWSVCSSSDQL